MKLVSTAKRMLRGEVNPRVAALEAARRVRVANERRRERAELAQLDQQPARLREEFARIRASDLLAHFRSRVKPRFLPGFHDLPRTAELQRTIFPRQTEQLITSARQIVDEHCWPLLGFGEKCFGEQEINWNIDPLSGFHWPLDFHADINLIRDDGSDARVTWELNRLAHLITLGRAYTITNDETFSHEFFRQIKDWRRQNPVARGVNWNCAMEVALRAMNLLAAFSLFLRAPQMDELMLKEFLQIVDSHGAHIKRNLEFSNIATSNHYLADITGLLWIGVMLPELQAADEWREFGLRELLSEMDKQTLADGADYEASTGYHRLKVELYLYSMVLCHLNGIEIADKYWTKLRSMIGYMAAYLRPDGRAPLIGDTDSGQVLPIVRRSADEHGYVLALGAAIFKEPRFELPSEELPEELLWILGEQGVRDYSSLPDGSLPESQAFPEAGIYLLRHKELYLLFNASDVGVNGRGSHGHNDALSIEVSACGVPFIVDPGTYLYTADLDERHRFRSTAYHSTVQVGDAEQNSIDKAMPFISGNEARPRVVTWESNAERDLIVAEHYGYQRLTPPVLHRRSVTFDKRRRFWLIEDELTGEGAHEFSFRFHFAPGLETEVRPDGIVLACDKIQGASLLIAPSSDQS
ncbi:MAG TPA: heparinase II/III family protein, partial [Pyrinomonadaceae bacterium]|nr:heparinase II/III family protein [Pyrinomonadaceae bacterium]